MRRLAIRNSNKWFRPIWWLMGLTTHHYLFVRYNAMGGCTALVVGFDTQWWCGQITIGASIGLIVGLAVVSVFGLVLASYGLPGAHSDPVCNTSRPT
jgi:hypothetical protein